MEQQGLEAEAPECCNTPTFAHQGVSARVSFGLGRDGGAVAVGGVSGAEAPECAIRVVFPGCVLFAPGPRSRSLAAFPATIVQQTTLLFGEREYLTNSES